MFDTFLIALLFSITGLAGAVMSILLIDTLFNADEKNRYINFMARPYRAAIISVQSGSGWMYNVGVLYILDLYNEGRITYQEMLTRGAVWSKAHPEDFKKSVHWTRSLEKRKK